MEGFVEGSRRPRHQNHHQRARRLSQLKGLRDDIVTGKAKFEGVASRFADCSSTKHGENAGLTKVRTVAEVLEPSQNQSYSVCLVVEGHHDFCNVLSRCSLGNDFCKLEIGREMDDYTREMMDLKSFLAKICAELRASVFEAIEEDDRVLEKERREESASEQLDSLRAKTIQQDELIVENSKELDVTKGNLVVALKEIEQDKEQMPGNCLKI